MARVFDRGDIVRVNLNPVAGHEMQGDMRPCLVISSAAFNRVAGASYVAPITQGGNYARLAGFAVSLMNSGCKTQGVAIMSMTSPVDLAARGARKVEKALILWWTRRWRSSPGCLRRWNRAWKYNKVRPTREKH